MKTGKWKNVRLKHLSRAISKQSNFLSKMKKERDLNPTNDQEKSIALITALKNDFSILNNTLEIE